MTDQADHQRLLDKLAQQLAEIHGIARYPQYEPGQRLRRVLAIASEAERTLRQLHAQDGQG